MISFQKLKPSDILVVCENTDHEFFTELNTANQMGIIHLNPANILEDVGIASMHLYNDPDETFPKELFIHLDPMGKASVNIEAVFQLQNLGTKAYHGKHDKIVFSYAFKGIGFDGEYYKMDNPEEIAEVMMELSNAEL